MPRAARRPSPDRSDDADPDAVRERIDAGRGAATKRPCLLMKLAKTACCHTALPRASNPRDGRSGRHPYLCG